MRAALAIVFVALALGAAACAVEEFDQYSVGSMSRSPRANPLERSNFFRDEGWDRNLVEGTVTHGPGEQTGRPPLSPALLRRGQESYVIHCVPCHGLTGRGSGIVVLRGYPQPPSYHEEYLRRAPDDHFYQVMVNGLGKMPRYRARVRHDLDRWAIIAYIRALQLSQNGRLDQVPPAERRLLEGPPPGGAR